MAAGNENEEFEFRLRAEQESKPESKPADAKPMSTWDKVKFGAELVNQLRPDRAITEVGLQAASGSLATPVAGLAGLATAGANAAGLTNAQPADVTQNVQQALTYQPSGAGGQMMSQGVNLPFTKLGQVADVAGQKVSDITGSPALGAAANTALQAAPAILSRRSGTLGRAATTAAEAPEAAARAYVARNTSLDWASLPDSLKQSLTSIAQDSKNLDRLDPKAVERQARLTRLNLPATRGQITRDLPQLTREEAITKSDAGAGIRDINAEQDRILHEHLDTLRKETGGKAETPGQVGSSVQGALRAKLRDAKDRAGKAYDLANELGEKELTKTDALQSFLSKPINKANVGWVSDRLKALQNPDGTISLKNLEDVRQELTSAAKNPNKGGHYASEAVKVIDKIMDESGSSAYKNARAAWKGMKDEFDKQGRIKKLVTEKGMSSDRATALEDTFDTVVRKGSSEDLQRVKRSLSTGDSPKTAARGRQAWKDLQAATIDYLKEKASGRRGITGEQGQLQFNSTFIDALSELDKDGKLDVLFGKGASAKLREISQATRDVRTKPSGRVAGSDTVPRMLNYLEKLAAIPVVGKYVAGAAKLGQKVSQLGSETREAGRAKTSPLADAEKQSAQNVRRKNTLESLKRNTPTAVLTLQGEQQ